MKRLLLLLSAGWLWLAAGLPAQAQTPVSGVMIQPASQPRDSATAIRLACRPSATSNNPLFIVDGQALGAEDGPGSLNLDDIEKLEVLKDPAATALYGSWAQHGAILITTKRKPVAKPYPQRPMEGVTAP